MTNKSRDEFVVLMKSIRYLSQVAEKLISPSMNLTPTDRTRSNAARCADWVEHITEDELEGMSFSGRIDNLVNAMAFLGGVIQSETILQEPGLYCPSKDELDQIIRDLAELKKEIAV